MFKTISKAALLAVVAGGLNLAVVAPAQAQDLGPAAGILCGFSSVTDPTIENGEVQTGEIDGGPIVATAPGATISLKCTIQVGAANAAHNGADSAVAASPATLQAAAVPPTLVSYSSPAGQPVYMCTEVTINGVTHYRDSINDVWSTSSGVGCSEAISQEIFPGPLGPVLDILFPILDGLFATIDGITQPIEEQIDLIICPVLASLGPAGVPGVVEIQDDGDIAILGVEFWLCPPYES